jgi:hypothetical protein
VIQNTPPTTLLAVFLRHTFHTFSRPFKVMPVSTVPKPVESCRFENHGFALFLGAFSSGLSASVSSFFRFSSPALHQS